MDRGARPARRRGSIAAVAVALAGLIVAAIVGRPGPSPVLATITLSSPVGPPVIGVDETAGRAYLVVRPGGPAGAGAVRVLDTATGALVATTALPGQNGGIAMTVDARHRRAYAASTGLTTCSSTGGGPQTCTTAGAALVMLDARTGRPLRTLAVDAGGGLTVDGQTGLLYALPSGGAAPPGLGGTTTLRVLDPSTGRSVRKIALPGGGKGFGFASLAIDGRDSRLVVARTSFGRSGAPVGSVDVVDLARGRFLRHIPLPGVGFVSLYHAPLIDAVRGRAYVGVGSYGSGASRVAVVDTRRGMLLHVSTTGAGIGDLAEDAQTGRVFATALGALRRVTMPTGSGVSSTQVPAGMGSIQVLDARTGALVRVVPIGVGTTDVAVDERRGRVYALSIGPGDARGGMTRPGTLSVVDERSGAVRTFAVGAVPVTLALDRRHDRLLVGCVGAFGGTPDDPWGWVPRSLRRLLSFLPRPPAPIFTPHGSVTVLDATRL